MPDTPKAGRKPKHSLEELEAENRRLRQENAKLLEQREVLKNHWVSSPKRRREICPNPTEERGPRLLEVRVAKIGADFSGYAESRVDRD